MNFDVSVNGRPWKIAIERAVETGELAVVVKGRRRVIDVSWIDAQTLSLLDGSNSHEVRFHRTPAGALMAQVEGHEFHVAAASAGRAPRRGLTPDRGTAPPGVARVVKAPMPGRIVKVLVAVGDRVAAQQAVVVVEAMKMENELRSPSEGVVKEVNARDGMAVDAGAVLVVVE